MKNEMYIMKTNGYTCVCVRFAETGRWYCSVCAPYGYFGDVNILDNDTDSVISALADQAAEYFPDETDMEQDYVAAYDGMSAEDIVCFERDTEMIFVCEA